MNDELDPGLRRLFAETAEHPADEAFVAAVTARTARMGRRSGLVRAVGGVVIGGLAFAALVLGLGVAVGQVAPVLNASPVGTEAALALVIAGAIYARTLAPLIWRRQP